MLQYNLLWGKLFVYEMGFSGIAKLFYSLSRTPANYLTKLSRTPANYLTKLSRTPANYLTNSLLNAFAIGFRFAFRFLNHH